jgi:hypothetical protein
MERFATSSVTVLQPADTKYAPRFPEINETTSGMLHTHYYLTPQGPLATAAARRVIRAAAEGPSRTLAEDSLTWVEGLLSSLAASAVDTNHIPPVSAYLPDDGSILLEWATSSYRIGLSLEGRAEGSSWFLATNPQLGSIAASGGLRRDLLPHLGSWLVAFMLFRS